MNVLITGGAGFIGSHLADHYLNHGHKVMVVDNLRTGKVSNLENNTNGKAVLCIENVNSKEDMSWFIDSSDIVYHLAAPVGVKLIMQNPVSSLLDNVRGTDVVLDLCNKYRKKVFVASSSEVYGKNLDLIENAMGKTLSEESYQVIGSTKNHRWAYANTKAFDEFLAFAYAKQYGLPVVIGRFFNVVGPRQIANYGMVIPNMIANAKKDEAIAIYGDGMQTRCFLHVSDAVRAIVGLMECDSATGDVYNIGGTEEISIFKLAEKIFQIMGKSFKSRIVDYQDAYGDGFEDMMRRTPDITKIKNMIGFEPMVGLDEIIKELVEL